MAHCCGCMGTTTVGIVAGGKTKLEELEEQLDNVGARKDVHVAFVLRWNTRTDIDSWMIEPNGAKIGWNTGYKGKVSGVNKYNYVLERVDANVNINDSKLTSNKGNLDKDAISDNPPQIENMVYFDRTYMQDGTYQYKLDDYAGEHTDGFTIFVITRNNRLEPDGIAELRFSGQWKQNPRQAKFNSPTYIEMYKQGDRFEFKIIDTRLQLVSSDGIHWRT